MAELPTVPVLLILSALVLVVVVQAWRLRRARGVAHEQRELARAHEAAAIREEARQAAAQERSARAVAGEWDAPALLADAGYEVLARQVAGSWTVRADGEPKTFGLRADYLVARDGRRLIAEVKTGRLAPSLSHGATRRQLLEYGAAFDVDGVLLVDADRGKITHVEIDLFTARPGPGGAAGRAGSSPWSAFRAALVVAAVSFGAGIAVGAALAR